MANDKIKGNKTVVIDAVGEQVFAELFPSSIRILADVDVSPPRLSIKASLIPYNHDSQKAYTESDMGNYMEKVSIDDVDAVGSIYPRVARLKDEMTTMLDLMFQLQTLQVQLAQADEASKPAIQAELDTIIADLA